MSALAERETSEYDADFYAWTQEQAELLRRLRVTDPAMPVGIDLDHIAEEIEDMGRSYLDMVKSRIEDIFVHILKFVSAPDAASAMKWRAESNRFSTDLLRRYARAMRQRIDLDQTWRLSLRRARTDLDVYDDRLADGMPTRCPFTLAELMEEDFDFDALAAKLRLLMN